MLTDFKIKLNILAAEQPLASAHAETKWQKKSHKQNTTKCYQGLMIHSSTFINTFYFTSLIVFIFIIRKEVQGKKFLKHSM